MQYYYLYSIIFIVFSILAKTIRFIQLLYCIVQYLVLYYCTIVTIVQYYYITPLYYLTLPMAAYLLDAAIGNEVEREAEQKEHQAFIDREFFRAGAS